MRKNEITFTENAIFSKARMQATIKSDRRRLILGRAVHTFQDGSRKLGKRLYYTPSPFGSHTEAVYIKGPPGSGKSWHAFSLAMQSFFAENRTWIIIDTKKQYVGNNRPNLKYNNEIKEMGGIPRGIPGSQIDIISPYYYVKMKSEKEVKDALVGNTYKIPLGLCSLQVMMELTRMNEKAQYATVFDSTFKELVASKNGIPKIQDFIDKFVEVAELPHNGQIKSTFYRLIDRIQDEGKHIIDDGIKWSTMGDALFRAAQERRARWIVLTLCLGDRPEEPMNLAIVSTILLELKKFAAVAKDYGLPIRLGIIIDELHAFTRDKDASTGMAIHDLLFLWGRTNKIHRLFLSLPPEEKIWCIDNKNNLKRIPIGEIVDNAIKNHPDLVTRYNNKCYEAIEQNVDDWKILSRNPNTMKIEVKPITGFIKHDNIDEIYEITLDNGKKISVTGCHSIFTLDQKSMKIIPVEVNKLKNGDWIEHAKAIPFVKDNKSMNIVREFINNNICLESIKIRSKSYINYLWDHYYDQLINQFKTYDEFYNTKRYNQIQLKYLKNLPKEAYSNSILEKYNAKMSAKPPSQPINCIILLDEDFWWLMGMITGDGCTSHCKNHNSIMIATEVPFLEKCRSIFINLFGLQSFTLDVDYRVKETFRENIKSGELWVDHIVIWHLINDILKIRSPAIIKSVPEILFQQPNKKIMSYLKGLHDADGLHTNRKESDQKTLITKSDQLARDVIQLWNKLGILSKFRKYDTAENNYIYHVTATMDHSEKSNTDFFPLSNESAIHITDNEKINNAQLIHHLKFKNNPYVTEHTAVKLASMCNCDEYTQNFKTIVEGDTRFSRIVQINKIDRDTKVYDISVDGFENFLSEDLIIAHNTQRDEQLTKVFRDSIQPIKPVGSYQMITECQSIPEPGYASHLNRICPNPFDPSLPTYYPQVKTCPPLAEVEDDEIDDERWKAKMREQFMKNSENGGKNLYAPDPRLFFNPHDLKSF